MVANVNGPEERVKPTPASPIDHSRRGSDANAFCPDHSKAEDMRSLPTYASMVSGSMTSGIWHHITPSCISSRSRQRKGVLEHRARAEQRYRGQTGKRRPASSRSGIRPLASTKRNWPELQDQLRAVFARRDGKDTSRSPWMKVHQQR